MLKYIPLTFPCVLSIIFLVLPLKKICLEEGEQGSCYTPYLNIENHSTKHRWKSQLWRFQLFEHPFYLSVGWKELVLDAKAQELRVAVREIIIWQTPAACGKFLK